MTNNLRPERPDNDLEGHSLYEIVQEIPDGAAQRHWNLRADYRCAGGSHWHSRGVQLSESPLYLELNWHETVDDPIQSVGIFRLNLNGLLRGGYIRLVSKSAHASEVRLRIFRADDGSFYVQTNQKGPRLLLASVRAPNSEALPNLDVDIHSFAATEGHKRLVLHLQRERNQTVVRNKKKLAASLNCEICGFSFGQVYGIAARDYCEAHHLLLLSEVEHTTQTRMEDLAILCANCHRVVHLRNPPYTLNEVRNMLGK